MADPKDIYEQRESVEDLERQLTEIKKLSPGDESEREIALLQARIDRVKREVYSKLTPWQKVQLARHPKRPYTLDYIQDIFTDFIELHGDRRFADDHAVVCGMANFHGQPVMVLGQQKGRDTKQKIFRNFGQPKPEGYRKALRVMKIAEKFGRPIFCFVDVQGAYPGIDAEERGQAEAIAHNLREMSRLRVPIVVTITGEGGSGGALAIAVGDVVNMLEYSVYSVISPEGCASIMWRDAAHAETAASALRLTADDLKELGLIDTIIPEPEGGAHNNPKQMSESLDKQLQKDLEMLKRVPVDQLTDRRYEKFRRMGQFFEDASAHSAQSS
ncbi:MAG: acetyl-CoA carboxylase carboxyltransferase subunit alpha [Acidobacteriia bacterium]|nr:acetyl-CoA carboxylase carboxyltransferase subunit alpha [Terriglobia bacterium]